MDRRNDRGHSGLEKGWDKGKKVYNTLCLENKGRLGCGPM